MNNNYRYQSMRNIRYIKEKNRSEQTERSIAHKHNERHKISSNNEKRITSFVRLSINNVNVRFFFLSV